MRNASLHYEISTSREKFRPREKFRNGEVPPPAPSMPPAEASSVALRESAGRLAGQYRDFGVPTIEQPSPIGGPQAGQIVVDHFRLIGVQHVRRDVRLSVRRPLPIRIFVADFQAVGRQR